LATVGYDDNVRLWTMPQPDPASFTARIPNGDFHHAAFSPDSRYVAVASGGPTTCVYDTQTGQQVGRIDASDPISVDACLLPDNERLAVYRAGIGDGPSG